mmetsp:Transcript_23064/g.54520  ORF Transcript_23064/g.54520 Transcript_23064/m.54520 type:complete len:83 (-) Transcript_23064:545-793(-)
MQKSSSSNQVVKVLRNALPFLHRCIVSTIFCLFMIQMNVFHNFRYACSSNEGQPVHNGKTRRDNPTTVKILFSNYPSLESRP